MKALFFVLLLFLGFGNAFCQHPRLVSLKTNKTYYLLSPGDSFKFEMTYDKLLVNEKVSVSLFDVIGDSLATYTLPASRLEYAGKNTYLGQMAIPQHAKTGVYFIHVQTQGEDKTKKTCKLVLEIENTTPKGKLLTKDQKHIVL